MFVTPVGQASPTVTPMTSSPVAELQHEYGSKATAVEPGGVEPIPLEDRHGRPSQMFWTWVSPNMEFATIFVGVIAVLFFPPGSTRSSRGSAGSRSTRSAGRWPCPP